MNELESNEIINSYLSKPTWNAWFGNVDARYMPRIINDIKTNTKLRIALLLVMYFNYKDEFNYKGSFDSFLNTPITLYRGISKGDKAGLNVGGGFKPYSFTKNRVSPYSVDTGEIDVITIKPKDTYGAVNIHKGGEVEVLVPSDTSKENVEQLFSDLVDENIDRFSEEQITNITKYHDDNDFENGLNYVQNILNGLNESNNKLNPNKMEKEKVVNYLYSIFNSKKNGTNEDDVNRMFSKAITMLSELYGVDVSEIEKQLKLGQQIEREHTKEDEQFQKIIALQHLAEKLDYYTGSKPKDWAEKEIDVEKSEDLKEIRKSFKKLIG